jgi:dCMP deaminase
MLKKKFIDYYMKMAELTAELSYAKRLQVGAVIVKNQQVIGTGYNGTPAGWDNNCENVEWCAGGGWLSPDEIEEGWPYEGIYLDADGNEMQGRYRLKTKPETLHSEMNALMKVARSTESSEGSTLFCTHAPCIDCAKAIYQAGIKNVYFRNHYRDDNGLRFLEKSGVNVTNYK